MYYLAFEHVKTLSVRRLVRELWRYLFTIAGAAIWTSPLEENFLSTVDCIEADRLEFTQDSSAGPEKLCKQAMELRVTAVLCCAVLCCAVLCCAVLCCAKHCRHAQLNCG